METSLHQQLKRCYAADDSNMEVVIGRYRIDAIRDEELIEVQCASLSAIRAKCQNLLKRHRVRIVKPVIARTRIAKVKKAGGKVVSRRMSPKRGSVLDVFEELIYFTRVFPHPNLTIEIPMVEVEQLRGPQRKSRRWHRGYKVHDVRLETIAEHIELRDPADLFRLIQWPRAPDHFNTADLASAIDRPRWFAQKVAYVLRQTGAIDAVNRSRTGVVYRQAS
jgi:hypothetical protein